MGYASYSYQVHRDHVINTNGRGKWQLAKQTSLTLFKEIIIQRVVTQFCKTTRLYMDIVGAQEQTAGELKNKSIKPEFYLRELANFDDSVLCKGGAASYACCYSLLILTALNPLSVVYGTNKSKSSHSG